MQAKIRSHIRSNVYGLVAVFIALGGTAYATHPGGANSISTGDIINDQVFTQDLANNNMTSLDIRDDTLTGGGLAAADLRPGSVGTSEVANASLGGADVNEATLGTVPSAAQADLLDGQDSSDFLSADAVHTGLVKMNAPRQRRRHADPLPEGPVDVHGYVRRVGRRHFPRAQYRGGLV